MRLKSRLRKLRSEGKFVAPLTLLAQANYQRVNLRDYFNRRKLDNSLSAIAPDTAPDRQVDFAMEAADRFLRPMQNRSELVRLMERVRAMQPRRILEIGTARGGTLFLFCRNAAPDATIVSLDLPYAINGGGYPEWKAPIYRSFAQSEQQLILLRRDSHLAASRDEVLRQAGSEPFDLIMIDADHRYEGVKRDFELYAPLVAPGGIIVMHDVLPNRYDAEIQVDRFWEEVKARYATEEIVEDPAQGNMGIGIVSNYHAAQPLEEPA
ncbi:MAG: class I SAM-dependent methyltransferase [Erythrobacter sp.]|nr:MAG: class I SAM-dependent methyltransferase [Erythrobacter sp.]